MNDEAILYTIRDKKTKRYISVHSGYQLDELRLAAIYRSPDAANKKAGVLQKDSDKYSYGFDLEVVELSVKAVSK